ncbi:SRPBCC family protein [Brachybacterium sp. GCM10030268]|uniref:SRPBCC family protein n=1 Tax=Brachybacterium sp. GCM10030268 TaxID=3273382 RepID=UPI00360C9028
MSERTAEDTSTKPWWKSALEQLPLDDLRSDLTEYASALAEKGTSALTDKLNDFAESMTPGEGGAAGEGLKKGAEKLSEGKNPATAGASALAAGAKEKLTPGSSGGSSSGGSSEVKKFSNIVETVEVGVPVRVAYNQWTQFQDWTGFMKKVENAEQQSEEKVEFKGQVFLSHRTWESTIVQQVPDEQIVWRSKGEKGHLDGAVTFHELGPRLTRILIVVNYYPQGFVEKVGNMGRPVGRRIRVEARLFARYVMTQTILDEDAVEGWRGEIRDSEVVRTHEEALEAERVAQDQQGEQDQQSQHGEQGQQSQHGEQGQQSQQGKEQQGQQAQDDEESPKDESAGTDESGDQSDESSGGDGTSEADAGESSDAADAEQESADTEQDSASTEQDSEGDQSDGGDGQDSGTDEDGGAGQDGDTENGDDGQNGGTDEGGGQSDGAEGDGTEEAGGTADAEGSSTEQDASTEPDEPAQEEDGDFEYVEVDPDDTSGSS